MELLVVVLIIGILAAVALPQYEKAVEKSRFATYRVLADSMARTVDVYYLENGTWPTSLDDLSIDFPAELSEETSITYNGTCRKGHKMYCCIQHPVSGNVSGIVSCGDNDYHLVYMRRYAKDDGTQSKISICLGKEEKYKNICKVISRQTYHTNGNNLGAPTPDGWKMGYFGYKID